MSRLNSLLSFPENATQLADDDCNRLEISRLEISMCLTVVWSAANQAAPHIPVSVQPLSVWCWPTMVSRIFFQS